ncbi:cold shock domain-containing protein [Niveibacterium terrae]|uniref:cold shock domain-containing protein n=1 Tax=Niveibacterium terrae TaxID=3373598 RepID=UPI003A94A710
MRFEGILVKWNDERGFGFIAPDVGNGEIFVHISAFPRNGQRPQLNEKLSFEVEPGDRGKKCAIRVQRPGQPHPAPRAKRQEKSAPNLFGALLFVAVVAVGAKTLWPKLHPSPVQPARASNSEQPATEALNSYRCDGRQYCSQMHSCDEAKYFLKHCPDVKMDGDHDGVPCEEQWCGN